MRHISLIFSGSLLRLIIMLRAINLKTVNDVCCISPPNWGNFYAHIAFVHLGWKCSTLKSVSGNVIQMMLILKIWFCIYFFCKNSSKVYKYIWYPIGNSKHILFQWVWSLHARANITKTKINVINAHVRKTNYLYLNLFKEIWE